MGLQKKYDEKDDDDGDDDYEQQFEQEWREWSEGGVGLWSLAIDYLQLSPTIVSPPAALNCALLHYLHYLHYFRFKTNKCLCVYLKKSFRQ